MDTKDSVATLKKKIQEQKRLISQLRHRVDKLNHLTIVLENSRDAITVQDFNGNITLWNKGAQKMYGWSPSQALKMNISEIVPPTKSTETLDFIKDISEGKEKTSFETKRLTADGRVLDVWLTGTPLLGEQDQPIAVATIERDITSNKQSEKEKGDLIKELQKTNSRLQKALAETRTLRGIVPICMVCKQIRNDEGFWEQVEVYVHNHTHADFSHAICPDCMKEKFPRTYQKTLLLNGHTPHELLE